ncbi:MAG: DPP IV N-terminal domain-containing protein [Salinibacter sp.]|uniref:DPP IV N-terminal domain-containing protein n=1 Tax=Salinibacter sp. TaxID=2065818 RepID=UPI0035D4BDA4
MSDEAPLRERFEGGFRVGDWFVEPMLNRVQLDDEEEVQLEPKVMEVLLCLADRPGETVTKDQFKDEVWTEAVVTDDVVSRCISELRTVFDDDPNDPSYIETIRKTGYRLIAPVRRPEASDLTPTDEAEPPSVLGKAEGRAPPVQRLLRSLYQKIQTTHVDAGEEWVLIAGGTIQRRWILIIGGLLGGLLIVGLVFWLASVVPSSTGTSPMSVRPFTSYSGEEFDPALSASGTRVVFAWRQPDSLDQNIYLMQRGAERRLQLSPDSTIDWSPTWSPNGRYVAYVRETEGTHQISIVPSIGGQGRIALNQPYRAIQSVAWVPDTSRRALVFSARRRPHQAYGLSLLLPNADSTVSLTTPPLWSKGDTEPTVSPDGSHIAFVRSPVQGRGDIFVVPISGGSPTRITTDSTTIDGLTWSADGSEILFTARRAGVSGLWRVEADGNGSPTLVRSASEGTAFGDPTLSVQSAQLAYTQRSSQLDIWKLDRSSRVAEFTAESLLSSTQDDTNPSIAPGGNRIAFVSTRSGTSEIWVASSDGSNPAPLTSLDGPEIRSIAWSPTGARLCFVAREDGKSDLYMVSASDGSSSRLTQTDSEDLIPRWSQDGRWIYFISNRTGQWEAWRVRTSPKARSVQQVTTGGAVAAQESATGSTLYFVRPDTTGIWTASLDTTRFPLETEPSPQNAIINTIVQFDPQDRRSWWVGESGIHFVHRRPNAAVLAYFDFSSRRILPLHGFSDWKAVQDVAVGPGGAWFAYTHVVRRESDIMLAESFR